MPTIQGNKCPLYHETNAHYTTKQMPTIPRNKCPLCVPGSHSLLYYASKQECGIPDECVASCMSVSRYVQRGPVQGIVCVCVCVYIYIYTYIYIYIYIYILCVFANYCLCFGVASTLTCRDVSTDILYVCVCTFMNRLIQYILCFRFCIGVALPRFMLLLYVCVLCLCVCASCVCVCMCVCVQY
jgi:hypothetical protein